MENKKRLIYAEDLFEPVDQSVLFVRKGGPGGGKTMAMYEQLFRKRVELAPTVDAVEVDVVAQMLYEAIGDYCPCNFNDNADWLSLVCDDCNVCGVHDDPLYCWKQYIKHYGERKENLP